MLMKKENNFGENKRELIKKLIYTHHHGHV